VELVQIETRVATVSKDETGIARIVYKAGAQVTIAEARENMEATAQAVGGVRSPLFIDIRPVSTIDREARQFFAGDEAGKVQSATALLVDSAISRVFGNFFIGINRPAWPVHMFTEESDAMSWLEGYID
jgi:hypothetical protein